MATLQPGTETILVVDDDPEMLGFVADALRMQGYTVLATIDPREALRWARTHPGPIHLLLSDVVMPLMHGGELAQEVRAILPGIKVMFMSGASPAEVADHGIGLAFGQPYLAKPFTVAALTNKVRAALDYRSPFSKPPPT
ncbi:MAG TPA: response regulator [Methylomirabilota bacterium]|jgi:DNA-binding response OmpR family regulator|nr:response regulator [Methylomirabilota bacterium]